MVGQFVAHTDRAVLVAGHGFARWIVIRVVFHDDAAVRMEDAVFRTDQHGQRAHGFGDGIAGGHVDDCVQAALQAGDGQRVLRGRMPRAVIFDVSGECVGEQA